jgi:hypothetical protein
MGAVGVEAFHETHATAQPGLGLKQSSLTNPVMTRQVSFQEKRAPSPLPMLCYLPTDQSHCPFLAVVPGASLESFDSTLQTLQGSIQIVCWFLGRFLPLLKNVKCNDIGQRKKLQKHAAIIRDRVARH